MLHSQLAEGSDGDKGAGAIAAERTCHMFYLVRFSSRKARLSTRAASFTPSKCHRAEEVSKKLSRIFEAAANDLDKQKSKSPDSPAAGSSLRKLDWTDEVTRSLLGVLGVRRTSRKANHQTHKWQTPSLANSTDKMEKLLKILEP